MPQVWQARRRRHGDKMALLGYSFAFLVLLGIVTWIVFPRLMRWAFIALCVFVGVAWLVDSPPPAPPPHHHELRR